MVEAARKIIPVLVDCDWGRQHKDISTKYGIRGYPTVIFVDSEGEEIERMNGRSADAIAGQINSLAEKHTKDMWISGWEKALKKAKKEKKPLAILFVATEKFDEWDSVKEWLEEDLEEDFGKVVWAYSLPKSDERKAIDKKLEEKDRTNAILIVDPREKEPFKKPLADTGKTNQDGMIKAVTAVLKAWKK